MKSIIHNIALLFSLIEVASCFNLNQHVLDSSRRRRLLPVLSESRAIMGPSPELLELFNKQVTHELAASQLYLAASVWFEQRDYSGFASYMLAESSEERTHALSFIDFAVKRSIPIELQNVPAPASNWETPEEVWKSILELEQANTNNLLNVAEAANDCHDFAVLAFLNPFHMEQVDSEDTISSILAKVCDENRTPGLLRQLDHELGVDAGGK